MAKAFGIAGIGISAAGRGTQEALNDGASFDQARLYGAASGAVEAGTEYMFDGIGMLGKMGGGFFDDILKTARPATGLRRILGNALEEGAEEAASGLVNPLLKTIYQGKEALNEYRQPEYWADVAKQAAYGGATALAYSGTIGRLQGAAGKRADVTSITEHMTELEEVRSEKWKAGTLDAKANETINKRLASDYELLSKKLQGMSESARSAAIRDNGLSSVVRQDGTLQDAAQNVVERLKGSADLTDASGKESATAAETAAEAVDVKYYTPTMTAGEVSDVLRKGNAKAITTELSREESRNYRDIRQAFSSLQSKTGIDLNLVVAETPQGSNGYYDKATGTVVIGRSRLSGDATSAADAWMATLTHEVYHKTGTTSSGQALTEYLNREDSALYWRSLDSFLRSGYLGDYENSRQIYQELRDKVGAGETLSTSEWETFSAISDEVNSIMVEKAIGNQRFAADLIAQDQGAIGRLIYRLRQSIEALRSSKNPTEVKMRERFRTAEKMFLDAAAESGYTYTNGKLIGGGEDEKEEPSESDDSMGNPDIRYSLSEKPDGKDTDGESEERKTSRVLTEVKPKEKSLEERARETWDNMILNFTDDQAAIIKEGQRLGIQDMDAKVNYTRAARNAAQYAMSKGGKQVDIDGREMGPSLSDVFRGAYNRGKEYQKEFYTYLLWMHHADRIRQGKTVMGDYTADEAIQEANRIVTRHPEMRAMAAKVWKYNDNLLKIREQYGLITHEAAKEMRRRYPHYVPTFRAEQGNGTAGAGADSRGMSVRSTIKTAVGSTKDIMPLLDSMAKQTMEVYQAGRLNEMIGTLVDAAEASGDITNIKIRSVADEQAEKKISDAQRTAGYEFAEALRRGEDPVNLLEDAESESYAGIRILDPNEYQNSVSYYRNGKRMIVQVTPEIYHGLKTYLPKAEIGNVLLDLVSRGNRTFKKLVTSKNPLFVIRNVAKDLQEAAFSTKYGIATFYRNLPRSYQQILKNGKYWKEYQMAGGLSSSIYDYYEGVKASEMRNKPSKDAGAREKITYGWEKASSSIEYVNMVTEQATRLTEFIMAREHGASLQQALLDSADVTTNFSRGGTFAKALNRTIMPFLNPSIQGWSKLTRGIVKTKGTQAWIRLIVKSVLLGILPAALNDLINRDNEWYDALPVSDKENYYIIALGKGNFLRIPKGRIQAAVGSLWVHGSEMAKGRENLGEAVSESFGTVMDQVSPVGNFTRNFFSPFTDIATNTTWYGSEIEGASLQSLKPSERYDNRTSEIAILIGKLINYSPKKIHYLIDQYTGVIGDLILPLTSRGNIKYPVISPLKDAFVVSAQTHNRYANDFYNKIDQLTQERNSGDLKSYFALRYLNSAASDISEMYGKKNEIEASDLSITDKRKQSDALTTLIGATQKAALENAEKLERISRTLDYSGRVDAISRSSEYRELDGKQKESVGDRMSDYYYNLARAEMTGEYPGAKQSLMKAMDDDSLFIALAQINRIEGDTDRNGNTVSGSRQKKIMSYINSLDIPKAKKYMLMGYLGYKNTSGGKDVMEYINGLDLSRAEKYMLYGLSGYDASGGKKEVWNYINHLNMDREDKQKLWKACGF